MAVIGAGSWGTTVAAIMSEHAPTTLWGRDPDLVAAIGDRHENSRYLAGIELPTSLRATTDLDRRVHRRRRRGDGGAVARLPRRARGRGRRTSAPTCRW